MVHFKDRYNYQSLCSHCGWVSKPSVLRLGVAIAPNPDVDRHPEIKVGKVWYDEKGWKHTILGRLQIVGKHIRVFCPECGKQCRSGPYSKTGAKNHYIQSYRGVGRPKEKDPEKIKEEVDEWIDKIKQNKATLEDVPPSRRSKVKRRIDKENEGKESNINN